MTPRELFGVLAIAERQYDLESAERMMRDALAARGEPDQLQRRYDEMTREP